MKHCTTTQIYLYGQTFLTAHKITISMLNRYLSIFTYSVTQPKCVTYQKKSAVSEDKTIYSEEKEYTKKSKQTQTAALLFSQLMTPSFVYFKLKLYIFLTHPICKPQYWLSKVWFANFHCNSFSFDKIFCVCVFLLSSVRRSIKRQLISNNKLVFTLLHFLNLFKF